MGTARQKAQRLPEKLLQVRLALGVSQTEMLKRLDAVDMVAYNRISDYELGRREPPLPILLQYARVAGVPTEVLIDDELDLPEHLPGTANHEEIKRKFAARSKRTVKTKKR
ncbi:MAG TPA: helix-turn-helix transcriptional regulator [Pyrinomonadaceae bacterium]|jgi:transcriptional regulator with XRE-family HTH domain|nr:helix-turn-helix transcriptional regulator [Pyrinomonadaceae bacterium]